jgi:hypothetical protein
MQVLQRLLATHEKLADSGKANISSGQSDGGPANKSKTAYYLDGGDFAKFMTEHGPRA